MPQDAVNNFLAPLQKALSCVTKSVFDVQGGYKPTEKPHVLLLNRGDGIHLTGTQLRLNITQQYQVVERAGEAGPWKVNTLAYRYRIEEGASGELIAFHWHPGSPAIDFPHIHIGPAARPENKLLQSMHIPSGRVAIEACLRMLIEEMGVKPLRQDWEQILETTQGAFEQWKTW